MGGGDLNLKKSWHPLTLHNLERVWKAEQNAEKEKTKLDQLRKEKQHERELEELQRLQDQVDGGRKRGEKLDWMYAGSSAMASSSTSEDYLLGRRRVDSVLNSQSQQTVAKPARAPQNLLADDQSALDKDLLRKVREDPMFKIKQQEQALQKKRSLAKKTQFADNYDLKLAISLSKTELEARKREAKPASTGFEQVLPPEDAFEVIKERLNMIYH